MADGVAGNILAVNRSAAWPCNCGQCGQCKKQLPTLPTKERKPAKREKAPTLFVDNVDNVPACFLLLPELRRAAPLPYIGIFLRSKKIIIHIVHTSPQTAPRFNPAWTIRAFSHCPLIVHIVHISRLKLITL
jgi:hypothetical protein